MDYEGDNIFDEVLKISTEKNSSKEYLSSLDVFNLSQEDNWELYALSRVLDILTLKFQPNNNKDGCDWLGANITLNEYEKFAELLGLKVLYPKVFHAFDCEIFESIPGENNFEIVKISIPSLWLKNLMIKRAGVTTTNNPKDYDLNLINDACIFWAFRRKNRGYYDESQGWGSNSQWRTRFRIDIETETSYIYNIDGKYSLNDPTDKALIEVREQKLELQKAIELLKNRLCINDTVDSDWAYPYNFKYVEYKI